MSYSKQVATLWPHLSIGADKCGREMIDAFYTLTYTYAGEDWGDRLSEGCDNDEPQRILYVFKLGLEFCMNGREGKPKLSEFWISLHQMVVCPLFKKAMSADLEELYISWPVKTYKLSKSKVQEIFDSVYVNKDPPTDEEDWACEHFYMWIMEDQANHIANLSFSQVKVDKKITDPGIKEIPVVQEKPIIKPKLKLKSFKVKKISPKEDD